MMIQLGDNRCTLDRGTVMHFFLLKLDRQTHDNSRETSDEVAQHGRQYAASVARHYAEMDSRRYSRHNESTQNCQPDLAASLSVTCHYISSVDDRAPDEATQFAIRLTWMHMEVLY
jgi:hypothetical protein